ncbi:TPA: hypothetical protein ACS5XR_005196, partial [Salmonella enterica]
CCRETGRSPRHVAGESSVNETECFRKHELQFIVQKIILLSGSTSTKNNQYVARGIPLGPSESELFKI